MINTNKPPSPDKELLYNHTIAHIRSKNVSTSSHELSSEIRALCPEELSLFVSRVVATVVEKRRAIEILEKFSTLLSTADLENSVKEHFPMFESALQAAQDLKAGSLDNIGENSPSISPLQTKLSEFCHFTASLFEGALEMFGLISLFEPSAPIDRTQKMILFFGLVSSISALLIPILGPAYGLLVMVGVALVLLLAGKLYPSIRPMPRQLPQMENWTKELLEGKLRAPTYLPHDTKPIVTALLKRKKTGEIPFLVGPSGVGKTTLIRSLTQKIGEGKYPELQGKIVHYVNAEKLKIESIDAISKEMGRHRENIILVFDNVDKVLQENSAFSVKMEEMLSDVSLFPNVVCITTDEKYKEKVLTRSALRQNGNRIPIKKPKTKEIQTILQRECLKYPEVLVDPKALKIIAKQGSRTIESSLSLLSQYVHRISEEQKTPLEKKVEKLRQEISRANQSHFSSCALNVPAEPKKIKKIGDLEAQLEKETHKKEKLLELQKTRASAREKTHLLAQRITETSSAQEQNLFLLLRHYFAPQLDQALRKKAKSLHLKMEIDEELVQSIRPLA